MDGLIQAVEAARNSVAYADADGDDFTRLAFRTTLADALHQAGAAKEALSLFQESEVLQAHWQPSQPMLHGLRGFRFCDYLMASGKIQVAIDRSNYALAIALEEGQLLPLALANLSLGRANAMFLPNTIDVAGQDMLRVQSYFSTATDILRKAQRDDFLPRCLLARAAIYRWQKRFENAMIDLNEARDLAFRGGMRLHLTDCHLETARLLLAQITPDSDRTDLRAAAETHYAEAADFIAATGYNRRLPELDAIRACLDGTIPAHILAPDRDAQGRPIWHDLALPLDSS